MAQRIFNPKRFQVYQDFQINPLEVQTAWGDNWAVNTTQTPGVAGIISNPSNEAGHAGLVQLNHPGTGYEELAITVGRAMPLKEWKRIAITLRVNDPLVATDGGVLGFIKSGAAAWADGAANWEIYGGLTTEFYAVTRYNSNGSLSTTTTVPASEVDVEEFHTFEVEIDYPNRRIHFYLDGVEKAEATPTASLWDVNVHPTIWIWWDAMATRSLLLDEFAFSTAAWEDSLDSQNGLPTCRIERPTESHLYDDFLFDPTTVKRVGEARWYAQDSSGDACDSTPTPVAGHPGIVRLTAIDQTTFSDAFLDSGLTSGTRKTFPPRSLKRVAITYKPTAIRTAHGDGADGPTFNSFDNSMSLGVSPGSYGEGRWYLTCSPLAGSDKQYVDLERLPLPDGNTWYTVELRFNYPNVQLVVNGDPCAEITPNDTWWDTLTHFVPCYSYTDETPPTNVWIDIDEVLIEFQPDTSDERPETHTEALDRRQRGSATIRTDNF